MPKGSCWCTAVRFEYTGPAQAKILCYCGTCQKISGAPLAVNLMVAKKDFTITQGSDNLSSFRQTHVWGPEVSVFFCKTCGTTTWRNLHHPQHSMNVVVQSGVLDEEDGIPGIDIEAPVEEIFTECRAKWLPATDLPLCNPEQNAKNYK